MTVQLYHGDCLEVMPTLETGSFDAIIADLPYGTTACKWDVVIPFVPLWAEYKRLIKPRGAIVLFGSQPFTSLLVTSNLDWFRYAWVWEKQQPTGFLDARRKPMKAHEDITVFSLNGHTYNPQGTTATEVNSGRKNKSGNGVYGHVRNDAYVQKEGNFPRSVIKINRVTHSQVHPTQKPVALLEYLVRTYTKPGDVVLDNTMGSGTTGVACIQTGRNFIGCEIDPTYYAIAQRRIAEAQLHPPLFPHEPQSQAVQAVLV